MKETPASDLERRKQVRLQLRNGADFIKIYVNNLSPSPYGGPTITAEEQQAIVDEAHRQGALVACTAHAGIAVPQSIDAGCDSLELVTDIDEQSVRMLVERGTFINFGLTITKLQATHRNFPMAEMSKASFQRALKAGATVEEIMEVLKLCVVQGVQACNMGVPILADELERSRKPAGGST